jgi:hypothetical protein
LTVHFSTRWCLLVALCLLAALPWAAAPARAQDTGEQPSANELWERYPLEASPEPGPAATVAAGEPQPAGTPSPPARSTPAAIGAEDAGVSALTVALLLLGAALLGAAVELLVSGLRSRSRARRRERPAPAPRAAARLAAVPPPPQDVPAPPAAEMEPPVPAAPGAPPDPSTAWEAEIRWHGADGRARFEAVARGGGDDATVVAESPDFEWPPTSDRSVEALTAAVDRLEAALFDAGWSRLEPGTAWYARRFAWAPGAGAADPQRPAGRFARSPVAHDDDGTPPERRALAEERRTS